MNWLKSVTEAATITPQGGTCKIDWLDPAGVVHRGQPLFDWDTALAWVAVQIAELPGWQFAISCGAAISS